MHNYDDKYPARPGFKPSTSSLHKGLDGVCIMTTHGLGYYLGLYVTYILDNVS